MNKEEFASYIHDLKMFQEELDFLCEHISAIAPGAVCDIGEKPFDSYISLLSKSVGDKDRWVSWFVYDNKFGKNKYKAGYDKGEKVIKTVSDLWDLIEEGKKKE